MKNQHSRLSASGSHRWIACPGSILMEEGIIKQSTAAADEGTRLHKIMSDWGNGLISQSDIDLEDREILDPCIDYIESINGLKLHDLKVDYSWALKEGFGTLDFMAWDPDTKLLTIVDYKFGNQKVYAEKNTQLLLYAIGAINLIYAFLNEYCLKIKLVILQPFGGELIAEEWVVTESIFQIELDKITKAAERALSVTEDNLCENLIAGDHCQWCAAKGNCRVYSEYVMESITEGFDDQRIIMRDKARLDDEEIEKILNNLDIINDWIKSLKEHTMEKLKSGKHNFVGWILGESNTHRQWKNKDEAEEELRKLVPPNKEIYKKTLISPAQAEKLVSKDKLRDLVYKPPGSIVLKKISNLELEDMVEGYEQN